MKKDRLVEIAELAAEELGVMIISDSKEGFQRAIYLGKEIQIKGWDLLVNGDFDISSKLKTGEKLKKHQIPHVECILLSSNIEIAKQEANQYFKEHGKFVLRGGSGFSGNNTFMISSENDIEKGFSILEKNKVQPFISPFYDAPFEYRVMWTGLEVDFAIKKIRNGEGFHNLSKGAQATLEADENVLKELYVLSKELSTIFDIQCGAFDILSTEKGLKVLELSIPNVGKFSKMSKENERLCINFFKKSFLYAFQNKKKILS